MMKNISNTSLVNAKASELKHGRKQGTEGLVTEHNNRAIKVDTSFSSIHKQNNRAILESSLQLSVKAGNQPMTLLFKTAIGGINEVLKETGFEEFSIQKAYDSGLDVSPEATAERILSMSISFYSQFQKQHPELTREESVNLFAETIGEGIEKGFGEARKILDELSVLEGDLAVNVDVTYNLVQTGLKAFVNSYIESYYS